MTEHHAVKLNGEHKQLFPLGSTPNRSELEPLGLKHDGDWKGDWILAVYAGSYRKPKKGEWYLSGAIVEAYRAEADLDTEYLIAKLVRVREVKILIVVNTENP
jgi:hypothetical protein